MGTSRTLTIPGRFNGPPDSAHGGYCSGAIAELLGAPAVVELRSPPPLDTPMTVLETDDGVEVHDEATLVARARPASPPRLRPPTTIGGEAARAAVAGYPGFVEHAFPTCFACGPARSAGDGLRIFPGPVPGTDVVAAPWRAEASLAGADGAVAPVFVWSALDCPSGFAVFEGRIAVLASLQVHQALPVPVDEELVVVGWGQGGQGRKIRGAAALQDGSGRVLAVADALWIELEAAPAPG